MRLLLATLLFSSCSSYVDLPEKYIKENFRTTKSDDDAIEIFYADGNLSRFIRERYVVKRGDTLTSLSKRFYGKVDYWRKIAVANKYIMNGDLTIYPGEELRIPKIDKKIRTGCFSYIYTIQPGDTLWEISQQFYGSKNYWYTIWNSNQSLIKSPGDIEVNMNLVIPQKSEAIDNNSKYQKEYEKINNIKPVKTKLKKKSKKIKKKKKTKKKSKR